MELRLCAQSVKMTAALQWSEAGNDTCTVLCAALCQAQARTLLFAVTFCCQKQTVFIL